MNGCPSDCGKATELAGKNRWMRVVVLGAICVLVIGVYAGSAHSGMIELFGSGAADSYYNLLVRGFRAGQLNLKTEVPAGLAQLADPYVPSANFPYRWIAGHPLHDLSYWQGKLYLYFGVTPALVLFWPYAALTGHYLLHKDAVVIFCAVGFLTSAGLLWAVWRRYFAGASFWVVAAGTLALGLATGIPVMLPRSDVYEVPISCGDALVMLALAAIWRALHDPRRRGRWLAAASMAYGLAVAARPSLLFGAVILLLPVIQAWRVAPEAGQRRQVWVLLLATAGPMVLIGMGLMLYNNLRFGNEVEFGQHYQLAGGRQDTMQQFSLRYLWFNFRVGFLAPARWSGRFPFVQDIAVPPLPKGASVEHPFGVLTNVPLVWLALAAPLAWRGRLGEARSVWRWFLLAVGLLIGTCALTLCLHNSMCLRYEVEFLSPLVLLAVIGVLGLERALASQPVWRRAMHWGWGGLVVFSVAFNLAMSFERQAEFHYALGSALFDKGQVDDAIKELRRALEIRPGFPDACYKLGAAFFQTRRVDEAIAQYQKALELQTDFAVVQYNLGLALFQKGRVDEAIVHYQRALELQPDAAEVYNNLGEALLQEGQVDAAFTQFQKAVELQPYNADAHSNLGNALVRRARIDDAMLHYKWALKLQPDNAIAHNNYANVLLQKGQVAEAISHYQEALETQPRFAAAHINLGNALFQAGRRKEAAVQFEKVLEIEPRNAAVENNLAWLLATSPEASLRDGTRSIGLAREASRLSGGENPTILRTLAAAYAEAGQFPEAIAIAKQALQLATVQTNTALVDAVRMQLGFFQAGAPFRETGQTKLTASPSQP